MMRISDDMDAAIKYAIRFGEIAVKKGFISKQQLREALEEQISNEPSLRLRPRKLIGEILSELGWITQSQISEVLKEMNEE
jgi:hypothetical protein